MWTRAQLDNNQWTWHDEPEPGADSYTIALIPEDVAQANNYFLLNYLPAGGADGRPRLELAGLDGGSHTYLPRVRALRVVGRR